MFGKDIDVTLISRNQQVLSGAHANTISQIERKLEEHGVTTVYNGKIMSVDSSRVTLADGRHLECNVPIWSTGAEAHRISADSDLAL